MKTLIIYNSKNGTTKKYANNIATFLHTKSETKVISIDEYKNGDLADIDYVFFGSWTSGLFIFAQGPDKEWKQFAAKLPKLGKTKIGLFTTYKLAIGSMFRKMAKSLNTDMSDTLFTIKSKNGLVSKKDKEILTSSQK